MAPRIVLIGLSGAGKSTVARLLAERLGFEWRDVDALVERETGARVGTLISERGEEAFRALEARALGTALREPAPRGVVVACGAGAPAREETRDLLRGRAFVVWLRVPPAVAAARLGAEGQAERPLLAGNAAERLEAQRRDREPAYRALADVEVDTGGCAPQEVAAAIEARYRERAGAWDSSGS